ncbi:peptidase C25 [Persicobacter psychrovividus]|uniref:Peptidase C25 n=2 Tax=Persicobacter psychrovividus TaxID=387638 RepID=A0ABN6LBE0_9BACT|nr:peptidase C25 [Persicobacter psychrovividus]
MYTSMDQKLQHIPFLTFFIALIMVIMGTSTAFAEGVSQLSTGKWVKLKVTRNGVYKVDRNMLASMGFDVDQLDPRKLAVYGKPGGMLPQPNDQNQIDQLAEMAIEVTGEEDGRFDNTDLLLFYAEGPDRIYYDDASDFISTEKNLYSRDAYVFLTLKAETGKRLSTSEDQQTGTIFNTFTEVIAHEEETYNLLGESGRMWFGERFAEQGSKTLDFNVAGLSSDGTLSVELRTLNTTFGSSDFNVAVNGNALGTLKVDGISDASYSDKGILGQGYFSAPSVLVVDPNSQALNFTITLSSSNQPNRYYGYLDALGINVERKLQLYDGMTVFSQKRAVGQEFQQYQVANANSNTQVWNVTDFQNASNQNARLSGATLTFGTNGTAWQQFVAFNPSESLTPEFIEDLPASDLRSQTNVDLIIISPAEFMSAATELAKHRTAQGLSVQVADLANIYNEFSFGAQDISAIRNYARYVYEKGNHQLKYLLLFGDCSFDYLDRSSKDTNFVPVYESRNSTHPIYSHSSDDYFGFLEANEGAWEENRSGDHTLEIGIGRLPVQTLEEANILVQKLKNYDQSPMGDWKSKVIYVADDGDNNLHQKQANEIAQLVHQEAPAFCPEKIFLDAHIRDSGNRGRSAATEKAIQKAFHDGAFLISYQGHGSFDQWANENIFTIPHIYELNNSEHLPIVITATCDFGVYDHPNIESGAELLLKRAEGGAIAMVTTTRKVFASTNQKLNIAFTHALFQRQQDGSRPRLGDVIRMTKNNALEGAVNRNFALLGDPSMPLGTAKQEVQFNTINGQSIDQLPNIAALDHVHIEGQVNKADGVINPQFSGIVNVKLFDKALQEETLGFRDPKMIYDVYENSLFNGQATVKNGLFSVDFVVPKNIIYKKDLGILQAYAYDNTDQQDALGGTNHLTIGGTSDQPAVAERKPEINLFINDTLFAEGGMTPQDFSLIGQLKSSVGIQISPNNIGQNPTAKLDDQAPEPLNKFIRSAVDDYTTAWIDYPFEGLQEGPHQITVKAYDNTNQMAEGTLHFMVTQQGQLILKNLINYPNPFKTATTFRFEHNAIGAPLDVTVTIYNQQGQRVSQIFKSFDHASSTVELEQWNPTNTNVVLTTGMYLFKLQVVNHDNGAKAENFNRFIYIP